MSADPDLRSELDHLHREVDRLEGRIDALETAIREHTGTIISGLESYFRRGLSSDLTPALRAVRALKEVASEEAA